MRGAHRPPRAASLACDPGERGAGQSLGTLIPVAEWHRYPNTFFAKYCWRHPTR
jgi:hypothetical protein